MKKEEHFEASDLSEVKQLLKSLDLVVNNDHDEDEVSHQAFYNTYARPDKDGQFNEANRLEKTYKALSELLRNKNDITIYWDAGNGSTLIQIIVNGTDFTHPNAETIEKVLTEEMIKTMKLLTHDEINHSKGKGKLILNPLLQIILKGISEEKYVVSERFEQADLWDNSPLSTLIETNRFFENTLPNASKFKGIRRGFHAETIPKDTASMDFFFIPTIELSTEENHSFSKLLLEKANALALKRHDYDFSKIKYLPTLEVNGQITDEKIAILNLEVSYMVFEKRDRTVMLNFQ